MDNLTKRYLDLANLYAKQFSQCKKVQVGSVIVDDSIDNNRLISLGTNITIPFNCKACGCLREQKYGENSKLHRNPEDCRAVHSEVNAILNAKTDVAGKSIYITRYPCEACARAIVNAGISRVFYGRAQKISEETAKIFYAYGVECYHIHDWEEEDVVE